MSVRPYRSGVLVKFGQLPAIPVGLYSATEREESFSTICDVGHDPLKVERPYICPACDNRDYATLKKGRENADGTLTVIDPEALKTAQASEELKGQMIVTAHPLKDVLDHTMPATTTYFVGAAKASKTLKGYTQAQLDQGFSLLKTLLLADPNITLVTQYAPSTKASMWRFGLLGDNVVVSQLVWPENIKEAPELPAITVGDQEKAVGKQLLELNVQPFDPANYVDTQKIAREAIVQASANGEILVPAAEPANTNIASLSLLDALQAAVAGAPVSVTTFEETDSPIEETAVA
jgi:non-homologous end joining protein Ku